MQSYTVDLGGQVIEYALIGENGPIIVLESGLGDTFKVWKGLIEHADIQGKFFLYNRAGYGKSKPSKSKRDGKTIAGELHSLLHQLQLMPPFILVGHSLGCAYTQIFAHQYSDEVAGMVLIDPMTAGMDELCQENGIREWRLSKLRKFFVSIFLSKDAKKELDQREISLQQAKTSKIGTAPIPVTIITADKGMSVLSKEIQRQWLRSHRILAHSIPGCIHITAENSEHHAQRDRPELIAEILEKLLPTATVNQIFQRTSR
jgi:pimeloyl-ACP methyl ester carboxylesterase